MTIIHADGRDLEYLHNGIRSDKAILFLHGTPGDASTWSKWLGEITAVTAIATSRPGYGLSHRHKGRSISDDLVDQARILDHLGVKSFVSVGWSGGGPHSLNMTRDPRCVASFTIAGFGEHGRDDLDFLGGMASENREEFSEALRGEVAITQWIETNAASFRTFTGDQMIEAFGTLLGEADKHALTPQIAEGFAVSFRRAVKDSFSGWIDDDLAFVREFGFDLSVINKPVVIWQGDEDFIVPKAHSEWLAKHIPTAELRLIPGLGHFSLGEELRSQIITEALSLLL